MHILFLTDNFPPEVNAPASRTFEHCREWVKAGHRVTVLTCTPNFPKGEVYTGYRNRLWQSADMEGIRVIRVWTYITANEGFLRRTLDYQSFMLGSILGAPFVHGVDVVVGTSPHFFTACAAYVVSRYKRIPFVFELRDLWPESIRVVGAMQDATWLNRLERVELFLYRKAACIVSVTQSFKRNLMDRGIPGDKINVVTNGVDRARFHPVPRDEKLAARLGLAGKFVAGYIGTHGMAHGLDTLLESAARLQDDVDGGDIRFLFLGDGACKGALKRRARKMGLKNVVFVDSVPKDQVVCYLSLLDISIIHLRKDELFKSVIPSKLFENMGMGIPVLHGVLGESAEIVRGTGCGKTFEPENVGELVMELKRLRCSGVLRRRYGANALQAAKNYDRRELAREMLRLLEATVNAHKKKTVTKGY